MTDLTNLLHHIADDGVTRGTVREGVRAFLQTLTAADQELAALQGLADLAEDDVIGNELALVQRIGGAATAGRREIENARKALRRVTSTFWDIESVAGEFKEEGDAEIP